MADHAHIGSIEEIAFFRARLLTFLSEARVAVEDCALDVAREQAWLEHNRRPHWEREFARRQRKLEEARQDLFRESLSSNRGPTSFHQLQVHRAERAVTEAQEKLTKIRTWSRTFENRTLPLVKQVERLQAVLTVDFGHAVQFLNHSLKALDAYSSRPPTPSNPIAATAPNPSADSAEGLPSAPAPASSSPPLTSAPRDLSPASEG